MKRLTAITLYIILVASTGCLNVADDRAELDRHIGKAQAGEASVEVEGGLANVRQFEAGRLEMWAQAPQLRIQLQTGAAEQWEIRLENALPDAQLTVSPTDESQTDEAPRSIAADETDVPTERVWQIDGLAPQTSYALSISPADGGDTSPWHFAVFADIQERIGEVDDIYQRMAADDELRFCLISGDLTEQGTPEELTRFERELKALPIPCYATLGNHELGYSESEFRERFGRGSFSFVFRGARFTLLDSASATLAPLVYEWLDDWLEAGSDGLHAVFMHITPLDPAGQRNGAFASRAEGNKLINLMADHGVDLSVYGHIHSYHAYSHAGIPAYISGGGGAIPERFDGIGRHYLKVEVDPGAQTFSTEVVRID
jgi:hypothetical protein